MSIESDGHLGLELVDGVAHHDDDPQLALDGDTERPFDRLGLPQRWRLQVSQDLLNQGRVDVVVNDSIAVYAYLAETNDNSVKIAGTVGEKSEQGFAARKDSGLLPELNTALDELRADGTLAQIGQKYFDRDVS